MMRLHVRAPTGTRIEQTERIVDKIEQSIRERHTCPGTAEHQRQHRCAALLRPGLLPDRQHRPAGRRHADPAQAASMLRRRFTRARSAELLAASFPAWRAYFQAADIISQVLNFGLPAAIDVQISGDDLERDYAIAARLRERLEQIPGIADLRIAEPLDYPAFKVDVDRAKALEMGIIEAAGRLQPADFAQRRHACCSQTSGSIPKPASITGDLADPAASSIDSSGALANTPTQSASQHRRPARTHRSCWANRGSTFQRTASTRPWSTITPCSG